jgi:glycosyltransferase involved in cell wall biosynthesis
VRALLDGGPIQPPTGEARKILFLLPFAPDLRGSHGGARACAAIIAMLAPHHRLRVLYLAPVGAAPPRQLPAGCESIEPIAITPPARKKRGPRTRLLATLSSAWRLPGWVEEARSPAVTERIAEVAADFEPDIVHCEFHVMAQYIRTIRDAVPNAKCIVTEHEPGIVANVRRGAPLTLRQRMGDMLRRRSWARYERETLSASDAVIVFTRSDADAVSGLLGLDRPEIRIIPLRLPHGDSLPSTRDSRVESDFLFVGNFVHPPNADAARRLVTSIFPKILEKLPISSLTIVGPDPPDDIAAAASDRLTITGWVDDPAIYLAGAAVVLVPLREGGGLRVKMIDACAAGKAIIASPTAVEGLSLAHGHELILAETDEEFADRAVSLMSDPDERARLETASRRWWEDEQDVERWLAEYDDLYASLGKSGKAQ